MKLEDAFKQSAISAAKRAVNKFTVYIYFNAKTYLNVNDEVILRIEGDKVPHYHTYPHLGALFNDALQKKFFEVKRYANDWQPHKKASNTTADTNDDEDVYVDDNGAVYEKDSMGFTYIDPEDDEDYDPEENIVRGLDGLIEFDADDDW